ncbi:hypothetical protein ColLi_09061 [Colletotrichum liriopes]|uniref:Uncharacterized protein n=1 Tax=Colletotrichum liriopes TaxID=708192 RepID=A0AA37GS39_9PEZI|nr:hypothetical protein ColLi_09061 [Colletotrichum liriopes]
MTEKQDVHDTLATINRIACWGRRHLCHYMCHHMCHLPHVTLPIHAAVPTAPADIPVLVQCSVIARVLKTSGAVVLISRTAAQAIVEIRREGVQRVRLAESGRGGGAAGCQGPQADALVQKAFKLFREMEDTERAAALEQRVDEEDTQPR